MRACTHNNQLDRDENVLWGRLKQGGDESVRAKIIERYFPLAKKHASIIYARRMIDDIDFDDYLHFAVLGLIESIDRFDLARDASFETFSSKRIRGAIFNGIEKYTELREQIGHRARIRRERLRSITQDAVSQPDDHQLFGNMADIVVNLALGYFLEDSDMSLSGGVHSGDHMLEAIGLDQIRQQVTAIVGMLPGRERMVIQYHYYHQMAFSEIADLLDLTKGRISQLHKRALEQIREALQSLLSLDEKY